jgi:transposase InsO family protein
MKANQAIWPVVTMARLLEVSASGFYAWLERKPSAHARRDADLLSRSRAIYTRSRGTYGMPRIHAELAEQGIHVGRKRVARLMRDAGLRGVSRRRWISTTQRQPDARPAPDLVQRHFNADRPDQLWVADATYVPTAVGFLYLAVVLDVFSRRVVGWAMGNHLRTALMLQALDMALAQRHPNGVIHHSDQGCPGRVQPVVATAPYASDDRCSHSFSAGVFQPRALRGRLLSAFATAASSSVP